MATVAVETLLCLFAWSLYKVNMAEGVLTQLPHPLPNYITLDYSDNSIVEIDYMEPVPKMIVFKLKNNGLRVFPNFENNTQVSKIVLTNNSLTSIPMHLLDILVNLTSLKLGTNQLSSLPDSSGLMSLRVLALTRNEFTEFPSLPNIGRTLTGLWIRYNQIRSLPSEKLAVLKAIDYIHIDNNTLTGSMPDMHVMGTLTFFTMIYNQVSEFDAEIVDGFRQGLNLKLDYNRIERIRGVFHLNNRTLMKLVTIQLGMG